MTCGNKTGGNTTPHTVTTGLVRGISQCGQKFGENRASLFGASTEVEINLFGIIGPDDFFTARKNPEWNVNEYERPVDNSSAFI